MKTERVINVYNKSDEEFVMEINIDSIEIEILKQVFNPGSDDLLMHYCYNINEKHILELSKYLNIEFDFSRFIYSMETYNIE